jgi:hypothetical protein
VIYYVPVEFTSPIVEVSYSDLYNLTIPKPYGYCYVDISVINSEPATFHAYEPIITPVWRFVVYPSLTVGLGLPVPSGGVDISYSDLYINNRVFRARELQNTTRTRFSAKSPLRRPRVLTELIVIYYEFTGFSHSAKILTIPLTVSKSLRNTEGSPKAITPVSQCSIVAEIFHRWV